MLKQLAAWVGIEAFFAGVGAYFRKHEYGNTELKDLLTELEATSGRDLSGWGAQWLETAGRQHAEARDRDRRGRHHHRRSASLQSAHPDYPTIRPHRLAIGFYEFDRASGRRRRPRAEARPHAPRRARHRRRGRPRSTRCSDSRSRTSCCSTTTTWPTPRSGWTTRASTPRSRTSPTSRTRWPGRWSGARRGTRPATREVAPSDYVDLVLGNIATETESTTIRLSLTQLAAGGPHLRGAREAGCDGPPRGRRALGSWPRRPRPARTRSSSS